MPRSPKPTRAPLVILTRDRDAADRLIAIDVHLVTRRGRQAYSCGGQIFGTLRQITRALAAAGFEQGAR
jgi:hypothetical protein